MSVNYIKDNIITLNLSNDPNVIILVIIFEEVTDLDLICNKSILRLL